MDRRRPAIRNGKHLTFILDIKVEWDLHVKAQHHVIGMPSKGRGNRKIRALNNI